jgi:hypothetical protein
VQDCQPVHLRHFQIEHNDIGVFLAEELEASLSILRKHHIIALPTEEGIEEMSDAPIIINHQNFGHVLLLESNGIRA